MKSVALLKIMEELFAIQPKNGLKMWYPYPIAVCHKNNVVIKASVKDMISEISKINING